jgi:hypothetical protein
MLILAEASLAHQGIDAFTRGDTPGYIESGRNLLLHGNFAAGGIPEIGRTPGYPLFLALVSLPGSTIAALAQVILSSLTVVLVWRLARAVFDDDRIALVSAWIFAFEPLSIFNCVLLQAETLFLVLFLLSLERLVQFLRDRNLRVLVEAGLWLAAATFVRPVTYYLPVALALGLFFVLVRVPVLRWKAPVVMLVTVLPWLAVWQIRNWAETGYSGYSAISVTNLYYWEAAEVISKIEHKPFFQVQREWGAGSMQNYIAIHPEQAGWTEAQRLAFLQSETSRILHKHFGTFLLTQLEGSVKVVISPGTSDLMSQMALVDAGEVQLMREGIHDQGPLQAALRFAKTHLMTGVLTAVLEILLLGTYLFTLKGIISGRAPSAYIWLLLGVTLYFIAVSGGGQAGGRYRLPVMPIVCVFAAAGIYRSKIIAHWMSNGVSFVKASGDYPGRSHNSDQLR